MAAKFLEATKAALKTYRLGLNVRQHAARHGISFSTLYRALREAKKKENGK